MRTLAEILCIMHLDICSEFKSSKGKLFLLSIQELIEYSIIQVLKSIVKTKLQPLNISGFKDKLENIMSGIHN